MKKLIVALVKVLAIFLLAFPASAATFTPMGQLYLSLGTPAGVPITELIDSWGYGTTKTYATQTNIDQGWISSPNLENAPYNLTCPNNGHITAVLLTIKAKVKTVKWSQYDSLGNIQISVRSPWNQLPTNEVVHAFSQKNPGHADLVTEDLNINTIPVGVISGVFQVYTNLTVGPYVTIDRIFYITGYWC